MVANGETGDFIDGKNKAWDVKAFKSREAVIERIKANARARGKPEPKLDPTRYMRGEFDLRESMNEIQENIEVSKEGVILDMRDLNAKDAATLLAEIAKREWKIDIDLVIYEP